MTPVTIPESSTACAFFMNRMLGNFPPVGKIFPRVWAFPAKMLFKKEGLVIPVVIRSETIELQQFLKLAGAAESGGHAKQMITSGLVLVNGLKETRRALKLRQGDKVSLENKSFEVVEEKPKPQDAP